jgi:hypothetical protein
LPPPEEPTPHPGTSLDHSYVGPDWMPADGLAAAGPLRIRTDHLLLDILAAPTAQSLAR